MHFGYKMHCLHSQLFEGKNVSRIIQAMFRVNISTMKAVQNQSIAHKIHFENYNYNPISLEYQHDRIHLFLSRMIELAGLQISKQQGFLTVCSFAVLGNESFVANIWKTSLTLPNRALQWEVPNTLSRNIPN